MDGVLAVLNNNKIIWGMSMLLLNFGSRYVIADLGKSHEIILSNEIVKKIIVMSMFFVATRDIVTSFLLTVSYIIIVDGVLHEKRKFCLLPKKIVNMANDARSNAVSKEDYVKAKSIVNAYESSNQDGFQSDVELHKKQLYINYLTNVAIAKGR